MSEEELVEFIILPLSYRNRKEKEDKIRETVKLAKQLKDRRQQVFVLSGILTFTDKLIDMETANQIRRTLAMTKVEKIFEEEKLQAVAKVEKEKRLALTKAEKEKKRADRAEAMLRQSARESVLKMLHKNYPTDEIAAIVSVFSRDEIEAMRKEMNTVS